ncbi:MAG: right-handed parallel beta-helix repeat-containing protein, partial [Armatimonadota bacterium]
MMLLNFAFVGVWITTLSLAAFQLSDASQIKAVYVAPNGNDSWTGAQPTPNKQKTDGPFASVTRARDAVRLLKQAAPGDTVKVILRGGTYYLTEPLAL